MDPKPTKRGASSRAGRAITPRPRESALVPSTVDPIFAAYIREIQKYPLLTREEEKELAVRFRETGDREALQRLVTSNLRFVVKIAFEYVHYRMKLLDLVQEGNMGLLKAVQDFDPYRDVRLTTYAVWWIRSYIQDALLKNHSLVKIGTTQAQKKLFYRLRSEQRELEKQGIAPDQRVKLLASRLDVREKDVREMEGRMSGADVSLNVPVGEEGKQDHLSRLADPGRGADETLGDNEQRELFRKILKTFGATLKGRDKVIFHDRLLAEDPLTLQEIGDRYGVTKERARQIEEGLRERLKQYVAANYPDYAILMESTDGRASGSRQ